MPTKKKSRVDLLKELFEEHGLDTEFFTSYAVYVAEKMAETDEILAAQQEMWHMLKGPEEAQLERLKGFAVLEGYGVPISMRTKVEAAYGMAVDDLPQVLMDTSFSVNVDVGSDFERAKADPKIHALGAAMAATTKEFLGIGAPGSPEEAFAARNVGVPNTAPHQAASIAASEVTPMDGIDTTKYSDIIAEVKKSAARFLASSAAQDLLVDARTRYLDNKHNQSKYRHDTSVDPTVMFPVSVLRVLSTFNRNTDGWKKMWETMQRWRVATIIRDAERLPIDTEMRVPAQLAVDMLECLQPSVEQGLLLPSSSSEAGTESDYYVDYVNLTKRWGINPIVFGMSDGAVTCDREHSAGVHIGVLVPGGSMGRSSAVEMAYEDSGKFAFVQTATYVPIQTGRISSQHPNTASKPRCADDYVSPTGRILRPDVQLKYSLVSSDTGRVSSNKSNVKEVDAAAPVGTHAQPLVSVDYASMELRVLMPFLFTDCFKRMAEESLYGGQEQKWLTEDLGIPITDLTNCVDVDEVHALVVNQLKHLFPEHMVFKAPEYLRPILHMLHRVGGNRYWTSAHYKNQFSLTVDGLPVPFSRLGFHSDGMGVNLQVDRDVSWGELGLGEDKQEPFTLTLACPRVHGEITFHSCRVKKYYYKGKFLHVRFGCYQTTSSVLSNQHGEAVRYFAGLR